MFFPGDVSYLTVDDIKDRRFSNRQILVQDGSAKKESDPTKAAVELGEALRYLRGY